MSEQSPDSGADMRELSSRDQLRGVSSGAHKGSSVGTASQGCPFLIASVFLVKDMVRIISEQAWWERIYRGP